MPIYPPRNNAIRKKEIFENVVYKLVKGIERKYSKEKIANLAERVRSAKMNLIKAKLNLLKSYKEEEYDISDLRKIENLNYEIMRWHSMGHDEISKEAEKIK